MAKFKVYHENLDEMKRLAKTDLPYPKDLLLKINQILPLRKENRTNYISTLELWEGKFLERVFAFKTDRRKKCLNQIIYKEVSRILEGNASKLVKDLYYAKMSGYHTLWSDRERKSWSWYYYYYYLTLDEEFRIESQSYYNVYPYEYFTDYNPKVEELIKADAHWPHEYMKNQNFQYALSLDNTIRYCGYDFYIKNPYRFFGFIQYISWYRVFPEIEMYAKFNLVHLVSDSRFYKKMTIDNKFKKFVLTSHKIISKKRLNYVDILRAYKSGKDLERYLYDKEMEFEIERYHITDEILLSNFEKVYKYIINQSSAINLRYYLDYYNAAKEFVSMSEIKHLMPHGLKYWHDYYIELKESKKREELEEKFNAAVNKWNWLNYKNKKFMIIVAPSQEAIIEEGKALFHCVGRMNYIDRMAEGNNLIMFIREVDKPTQSFYTVEFDKEIKSIVQCRGYKNSQITRWDEVKTFTEEWLKKIPYLKRKKEKKEEKVIEHSGINRASNKGSGTQADQQRVSLRAIHAGC